MTSRAPTLCLFSVALAACSPDVDHLKFLGPEPCFADPGKEIPIAHIGPDVAVTLFCGERRDIAVATISNRGPGDVPWSASSDGDPTIFQLQTPGGHACQGDQASPVIVTLIAPRAPAPGQTFDATITVRAERSLFPSGTVKVHIGAVVPLTIASNRPVVDFGDVVPGETRFELVSLINNSPGPVWIEGGPTPPDVRLQGMPGRAGRGQTLDWFIALTPPSTLGDYAAEVGWRATAGPGGFGPRPGEPFGGVCTAATTVAVKAHVSASADAGSD